MTSFRELELGGKPLYRDASTLRVLLSLISVPASGVSSAFYRIWLIHVDGSDPEDYSVDDTGLAAANAAASAGDDIVIPPYSAFADDYTVGADVAFIGQSPYATKFTGQTTLNPGSYIKNLGINRTDNSGGDLIGVIGPGSGKGYVINCAVTCDQNGAGDAIGLQMGAGDIDSRESFFDGDSAGGDGYGITGDGGACNLSAGTWAMGTTAPTDGDEIRGINFDTYIKLLDSAGTLVKLYPFMDAGLIAANSAGTSGDIIYLPVGTLANSDITTTDGVKVVGASRYATILTGEVTGGDGGSLENLSVIRSADSADTLKGLVVAGVDTFYAHNCDIEATQIGSGDAYGVSVEANGAILECWNCFLSGVASGAGDGYGTWRDTGTSAIIRAFGGRIIGNTGSCNE